MFFIIINILSGCSFKGLSEMMLEEKNQDLPSSIGTISSDFSFAVLGTGEIAFHTIDPKEVVFLDEKQKSRRSVELSENRQSLEITAGNDYFYVYCSNEDETAGFLNVFDKKGELIKEISLPFSRVSVAMELCMDIMMKQLILMDGILISRIVILKQPIILVRENFQKNFLTVWMIGMK